MSEQHPLREEDAIQDEAMPEGKPKPKGEGIKPLLYTESLSEIFGFSELDLNTNRNGMATAPQKEQIKADLKDDADGMWLMITSLLGVTLLLALIMASSGIPTMYLLIGAGVILLPLLAFSYRRQNKTRKDAENLRVKSAQGVPHIQYSRFSEGGRYVLHVGDARLPISMNEAHAMAEYEVGSMRVYYAENSKILLSAETVRAADIDKLKNDDLHDIEIIEADEASDMVSTGRQLK